MKKRVDGAAIITAERERQIEGEGWTDEHDAKYTEGQLASAAACYALADRDRRGFYGDSSIKKYWPWDPVWWKPTPDDRIRELAKAGALIAAEIDRIMRKEKEEDE